MASSIYVTTAEAHCGKSLICLGIIEMILRKTKRVGIFRPIISQKNNIDKDKNINLILSHFKLGIDYEDTYAFLQKEARTLAGQGKHDELINKVIQKYKNLEKQCDFILVEGIDFTDEGSSFEFDINVEIARNLGCPVLIVGRGDAGREVDDIVNSVTLATESYSEKECQILGTIINRANPELAHEILMGLMEKQNDKSQVVAVIPENEILKSPTIKEIAQHLDAEILLGHEQLDRQAFRFSVAAMQFHNYLETLTENCLVITPGDRGDIILSALQAHQSKNYPSIAGIILTTGLKPYNSVIKLLEGLPNIVPILSVKNNTFDTSSKLNNIHSYVTVENQEKIAISQKIFEKYVDSRSLEEKISTVKTRGITPKMFEYNLIQKAKSKKQHIVMPEGKDPRVLKAAAILTDQDIVKITLIGKPEEIENEINKQGINIELEKVNIVHPQDSPKFQSYVDKFYEMRKEKGATLENSRDTMCDVSYFGTMMVLLGDADGMVSGAVHTTQHTIRPALQLIKTKPGVSVVSSVFFMCLEDRVLVYGDCAVNPNPNAEQLAEIAISSAETSISFDVEPKIAMLSYSSGESGKGADVEKVREATKIAKSKKPDLKIEGPIQYDAAVDKSVGLQKMPGSEVAGQASVLIFPDLNTGNNTYKAVQRETGAIAIGPVLQGLNKPVNDLSRGCTVPDIVNTVVITAIQGQLT